MSLYYHTLDTLLTLKSCVGNNKRCHSKIIEISDDEENKMKKEKSIPCNESTEEDDEVKVVIIHREVEICDLSEEGNTAWDVVLVSSSE
jgi:hypothetical protein